MASTWGPDLTSAGDDVDGDVIDDRDDRCRSVPEGLCDMAVGGRVVGRRWIPSVGSGAWWNGFLVATGINNPLRNDARIPFATRRKECW